jgi:predicted DNA-binding transcriptional regulator AlpA
MNNNNPTNLSNILRLKHSADYLSISLTTLWRLGETDPKFPNKIQITSRCCGYLRSDLDKYLAEKSRGAL